MSPGTGRQQTTLLRTSRFLVDRAALMLSSGFRVSCRPLVSNKPVNNPEPNTANNPGHSPWPQSLATVPDHSVVTSSWCHFAFAIIQIRVNCCHEMHKAGSPHRRIYTHQSILRAWARRDRPDTQCLCAEFEHNPRSRL